MATTSSLLDPSLATLSSGEPEERLHGVAQPDVGCIWSQFAKDCDGCSCDQDGRTCDMLLCDAVQLKKFDQAL